MSRAKRSDTRKSPYQRYGKVPYKYEFRDCSHANSVRQSITAKTRDGSTAQWTGKVCTRCNTITDGPYR